MKLTWVILSLLSLCDVVQGLGSDREVNYFRSYVDSFNPEQQKRKEEFIKTFHEALSKQLALSQFDSPFEQHSRDLQIPDVADLFGNVCRQPFRKLVVSTCRWTIVSAICSLLKAVAPNSVAGVCILDVEVEAQDDILDIALGGEGRFDSFGTGPFSDASRAVEESLQDAADLKKFECILGASITGVARIFGYRICDEQLATIVELIMNIQQQGVGGTAENMCELAVDCSCGECPLTCDPDQTSGSQTLTRCALLIPNSRKYECCDERVSLGQCTFAGRKEIVDPVTKEDYCCPLSSTLELPCPGAINASISDTKDTFVNITATGQIAVDIKRQQLLSECCTKQPNYPDQCGFEKPPVTINFLAVGETHCCLKNTDKELNTCPGNAVAGSESDSTMMIAALVSGAFALIAAVGMRYRKVIAAIIGDSDSSTTAANIPVAREVTQPPGLMLKTRNSFKRWTQTPAESGSSITDEVVTQMDRNNSDTIGSYDVKGLRNGTPGPPLNFRQKQAPAPPPKTLSKGYYFFNSRD